MRVGIIGLLHESNTFVRRPTTIADFQNEMLLDGEAVRIRMSSSQHEIGGFFDGLQRSGGNRSIEIEAAPVFVARAFPSGTVTADAWRELLSRMFDALDRAGPLDGILAAPHGATVSEEYPDADGHWLSELRKRVGDKVPIIGTLDAHANLSRRMVDACNALIAYRTNPHLDQRDRGIEAAQMMAATIRGEIQPVMRAEFPPLAINIDKQMTSVPPLQPLYELADRQLKGSGLLSNSIVLGFPYADVAEMGSSVIAVSNGNVSLASRSSRELAEALWSHREEFSGRLVGIDEALAEAAKITGPVCLLDMGDNVGGGSAADGTALMNALHQREIFGAFGCLFDPSAVQQAERTRVGNRVRLSMGGKTDDLHGPPLVADVLVRSLHEGRFSEPRVRHGGFAEFDQGRTAIVETEKGLTVMLTSRRMVPFSLQQLTSCGLEPQRFRILVAKGVNAPVAAYREVCRQFIQVDTPGSTCADITQLPFHHRRAPMFPFERDAKWAP